MFHVGTGQLRSEPQREGLETELLSWPVLPVLLAQMDRDGLGRQRKDRSAWKTGPGKRTLDSTLSERSDRTLRLHFAGKQERSWKSTE